MLFGQGCRKMLYRDGTVALGHRGWFCSFCHGDAAEKVRLAKLVEAMLIKRRLFALAGVWLDLVDRIDYLMPRQTLKFMDMPGRRHPERT